MEAIRLLTSEAPRTHKVDDGLPFSNKWFRVGHWWPSSLEVTFKLGGWISYKHRVASFKLGAYLCIFCKSGVLVLGVLMIRALLFGAYTKVSDFWKLPFSGQ